MPGVGWESCRSRFRPQAGAYLLRCKLRSRPAQSSWPAHARRMARPRQKQPRIGLARQHEDESIWSGTTWPVKVQGWQPVWRLHLSKVYPNFVTVKPRYALCGAGSSQMRDRRRCGSGFGCECVCMKMPARRTHKVWSWLIALAVCMPVPCPAHYRELICKEKSEGSYQTGSTYPFSLTRRTTASTTSGAYSVPRFFTISANAESKPTAGR